MKKKKASTLLEQMLTPETLLEWADDRYFARGEKYFDQERVQELASNGNEISAQVRGSKTYDVEFWIEADELHASCSCPVGLDELFCKHCVAVGLAWLADLKSAKPQKKSRSTQKPVTLDEIQNFLKQQDKSTLAQ